MRPALAMREFDQAATETYSANLALDMAKRALARASADSSGAVGFASELFAEAASYFASRDLPSYVGGPGRISTTSAVIGFKDELREIARRTARLSGNVRTDSDGWRAYVNDILSSLQGGKA
jgi:hypothetical protein